MVVILNGWTGPPVLADVERDTKFGKEHAQTQYQKARERIAVTLVTAQK